MREHFVLLGRLTVLKLRGRPIPGGATHLYASGKAEPGDYVKLIGENVYFWDEDSRVWCSPGQGDARNMIPLSILSAGELSEFSHVREV